MSASKSQAVLARLASLLLAGSLAGTWAHAQGAPCTPTGNTFNEWKLHTMCLASRREVPRALAALGKSDQTDAELAGRLRGQAMPEAQDEFLKGQAQFDAKSTPAARLAFLREHSEKALGRVRASLERLVALEQFIASDDARTGRLLDAISAGPGAPGLGSGRIFPTAPLAPTEMMGEGKTPAPAPSAVTPVAANNSAGSGAPGSGTGEALPVPSAGNTPVGGGKGTSGGPISAGPGAPGSGTGGALPPAPKDAKKEGPRDLVDLTKAGGRAVGRFFGKIGRAFGGGDSTPPTLKPEPATVAAPKPAPPVPPSLPVTTGIPEGLFPTVPLAEPPVIEARPLPLSVGPIIVPPGSASLPLAVAPVVGPKVTLPPPTVPERIYEATDQMKARIVRVYESFVGAQQAIGKPLPPEVTKQVVATMFRESAGNPLAIGDAGQARGLLQMHPAAAKDAGCTDLEYVTGDARCSAKWAALLHESLSRESKFWYKDSPESFGLVNVMGRQGFANHSSGRAPQPNTASDYLGGKWGLKAWMDRVGSALGISGK